MYKNSIVLHITKLLVDVLFYIGMICVVAVPFWAGRLLNYYGYTDNGIIVFSAILFVSGICAVYILFVLKQMFKTLLGGNPFVEQNTNSFRKMAVACALIAAIYIFKCFIMFTWATVIIALVFAIGTLFCLTLKDLFKQSVYYKEENDWTV